MANNIFSNMANNFGDWMASKIAPYINDALGVRGSILGNYYQGDHRPQLKRKLDAKSGLVIDDNITQNFVGLAVDRSVSRLFRGGVKWKLPDGADAQQEYLNKVWDLNKKEIVLYQVGLHGAVYGTSYFKVSPDVLLDPYTDEPYPELIPIDPETVRIKVDPENMNRVIEYRIEYKCGEERNGRITEVAHREITKKAMSEAYTENGIEIPPQPTNAWVIQEWEQVGGSPWQMVEEIPWDYNFPPIIHWKNLPSLKSCYGDSDIDDAINIQDKSNFVASNIGKIIKFFAHPETIGTGFSVKEMTSLEAAVGSFKAIPNENAKVFNLEMQSDLASSREFAANLRQSIFDIAREVDISSMADKIGALTNFGLQILWSDATDKNDTKRQLYGDALLELNRRLLVLANFTGEQSNPGTIQWGNPLPVNIKEEMDADQEALNMKIVDRETVASRYEFRYGKKWEDIKKAIEEQDSADNANNANIGATILKNFQQGKGMPSQMNNQPNRGIVQKGQ